MKPQSKHSHITAVADNVVVIPDEDGAKVVLHFVNAATFTVRPGSYLTLVFERPVTFRVVQG